MINIKEHLALWIMVLAQSVGFIVHMDTELWRFNFLGMLIIICTIYICTHIKAKK